MAAPVLKTPQSKKVLAGRRLKLNCKVTNKVFPMYISIYQVTNKVFPWPAIAWYKDGALLSSQDPRIGIQSKK